MSVLAQEEITCETFRKIIFKQKDWERHTHDKPTTTCNQQHAVIWTRRLSDCGKDLRFVLTGNDKETWKTFLIEMEHHYSTIKSQILERLTPIDESKESCHVIFGWDTIPVQGLYYISLERYISGILGNSWR